MHKIEIIGYLASDPKADELNDRNFVCNFRVLANNPGSERPIGFNVAAWNELGKACQRFLVKGRQVYIAGQLRYIPETGNPRAFTRREDLSTGCAFEIDANIVEFLNSKQPKPTQEKDHQ
jgi:single-stranded DNA-binding protein